VQVRAARGFRRELARRAIASLFAVERIETGTKLAKGLIDGLARVQSALEAEGIEFTDEDSVLGVKLHPKKRRVTTNQQALKPKGK
jgi:hypothetical protein